MSEDARRILEMLSEGAIGGAGAEEGVRLRIPVSLLQAGIGLGGFIPEGAREQISAKPRGKGIKEDIFEVPEHRIDAFIRILAELQFEAGDKQGNLRIYLE